MMAHAHEPRRQGHVSPPGQRQCAICLNKYEDPRALPCLHTFCLTCIKEHIEVTLSPCRRYSCPTCREQFLVPEGGAEDLRQNFHVQTDHNTWRLKREGEVQKCEVHENQVVDQYCHTCQDVVCSRCALGDDHQEHKCEDLEEKVYLELQIMTRQTEEVLRKIRKAMQSCEQENSSCDRDLRKCRYRVNQVADNLIRMVEQQKMSLLGQLDSVQISWNSKMKGTQHQQRQLESDATAIHETCTGLTNELTARQVSQTMTSIRRSLSELQTAAMPAGTWKFSLDSVENELLAQMNIGSVKTSPMSRRVLARQDSSKEMPEVTRIVGGISLDPPQPVSGMVVHGGSLWITHHGNRKLWVYSPEGYLDTSLDVDGLQNPHHMTALVKPHRESVILVISECSRQMLLWVTVTMKKELWCVQSSLKKTLKYEPCGVSVTSDNHVTACDKHNHRVCMYNELGEQVRVINLPAGVHPWKLVQVYDGGFIILDDIKSQLVRLDHEGQLLWKEHHFDAREWQDMVIDTAGYLLVANYKTQAIDLLNCLGQHLGDIIGGGDKDAVVISGSMRSIHSLAGVNRSSNRGSNSHLRVSENSHVKGSQDTDGDVKGLNRAANLSSISDMDDVKGLHRAANLSCRSDIGMSAGGGDIYHPRRLCLNNKHQILYVCHGPVEGKHQILGYDYRPPAAPAASFGMQMKVSMLNPEASVIDVPHGALC